MHGGIFKNIFFFLASRKKKPSVHTQTAFTKFISSISRCRLSRQAHSKPGGGGITSKRKDMLTNQKPEFPN